MMNSTHTASATRVIVSRRCELRDPIPTGFGAPASTLQSVHANLIRMSTEAIDTACVALRSFVHVSGALRAQALIPMGSAPPVIVSCTRLGPLEIVIGERSVQLPHDVEFDVAEPDLGALGPMPPFEVSAERGEVAGLIGGVDALRDAVVALAAAIGGGAAVVVEMETTAPDAPFVLSARTGEPVLALIGEEEFELE